MTILFLYWYGQLLWWKNVKNKSLSRTLLVTYPAGLITDCISSLLIRRLRSALLIIGRGRLPKTKSVLLPHIIKRRQSATGNSDKLQSSRMSKHSAVELNNDCIYGFVMLCGAPKAGFYCTVEWNHIWYQLSGALTNQDSTVLISWLPKTVFKIPWLERSR